MKQEACPNTEKKCSGPEGCGMMKVAAREFSLAAKVLAESPHYSVETGSLLLPLCTALSHAIECHLKAFLCLRGLALKDLERAPYGHDLRALVSEAYKIGMPKFKQLDELVKIVADGSSRATKFAFRYPKPTDSYTKLKKHEIVEAINNLEAGFQEAEARTPLISSSVSSSEDSYSLKSTHHQKGRTAVTRIFEKEIPLGNKTQDEIEEEYRNAEWAGVEFGFEIRRSYVLVRVEADDKKSALMHKLKAEDFVEKSS
ncbi:hypothetical protein NKW55_09060 [Gluconobacter kondonii]|uniref:hypothetical protein n=2 Tax=Acetobacteraceae TaxID=433 RepID=UPI0020A01BF1|nr:hypothetical protein [Gluconobacter kondonii]MCP1236757.1 hypothetical protein [Gluconobacter kondonii]